MGIAILRLSDWAASERESILRYPTWPQVEAAIRALNNDNLNDLYLQPDENDPATYLAIGGGAGRYILTGSIKNETFPTLVGTDRPPAPQVQLVVGGQLGDYPGNWVTDLSTTLETTKLFVEAGGFESNVPWASV